MRGRCYQKANGSYHNYGAVGIKVCRRWDKFENFLADMGERPKGLTIERKNNDKGYTPSNCVWATYQQQMINRTSTHFITAYGKTLHLTEWARKLNVQPSAIRWRIENGWKEEQAVTTPARKDSRRVLRQHPIGYW